MSRKILVVVSVIFFTTNLFAKEVIYVTAYSAVLMNAWNKKVLYSKNPHVKLAPASTTKIMTALVVMKKSSLDKKVIVPKSATWMPPSRVDIKTGEVYTTEDMLKAALLNSGNDATVALAVSVAGSEKEFTNMMNEMARKLGCRNTNFKTSNGLPAKNQYITAYDLALIMREAMKNKKLAEILETKRTEISELNTGRRIKLKNHNKSLWKETSYAILGKTGYTIKAGQCFAGYIIYDNKRKLIVVMLKGKKLWPDLKELAEKGKRLF
ncbi:MAG: D-alanyl-D-alanine carboxypeptidase family protein [Candidatus Omnitrophota bacterium]|nr:D-alanyl-D-alanine carboxypeptidase family protein [Candidatus Omnitrophota bacterium]